MANKKILLCGWKGYIGFALLQRLLNEGYIVRGIDNNQRHNDVEEQNSQSVTNLTHDSFQDNINFKAYNIDIAREVSQLDEIFKNFIPDIVINLAHIPSAPYSQIDLEHADYTLTNNFNGTNNLLWLVKKYNSEAHYITIGTAGEYNHYANIDVEEGYFKFVHNGRQSEECIFPRRPGSIYHTSKVASTYLIDFLTRTWGLYTTDVMQGVVFGLYTDECHKNKQYTRFDSDECFGTVINRFCVQSLLGVPLTVYGKGQHKRTFISLNDSVQALMIAVNNKPSRGKTQVWNQLSEWHSMVDLANMVKDASKELSIETSIEFIETPRNEITEDHYYNFITDKLSSLGYNPTRNIKEEIIYTLNILKQNLSEEKKDILRKVVKPNITWS